jgi:adenylosuccinate synthase
VLVGLQFGDEGKGKVTDMLASASDAVVRFQGGSNAGHRIIWGEQEFAFRLIPSGVLYPGKLAIVGCGVVVDPEVLLGEISSLRGRGIDMSGFRVSANAHVIMPYHKLVDESLELRLGKRQIGTTKNGIGPCYSDKALRIGIRVQDTLDERILREKLTVALEVNGRIRGAWRAKDLDLQEMLQEHLVLGAELAPHITDTTRLVWELLAEDKMVLLEGAQGTLLDVDHGTYPFVTSSNTVAGAACPGAGVGPRDITEIWGVAKAYATRVGAGPFPSELHQDPASYLQERGHEFGTVTGRRRRVGWLDLVSLRHAIRLNSVTHLAITKLDILSGLDTVGFAVGYEGADEARFEDLPYHQSIVEQVSPVVEHMPGWSEDLSRCRRWGDLPSEAVAVLELIGDVVGVPVAVVGVGPEREQIIWNQAGRDDSILAAGLA